MSAIPAQAAVQPAPEDLLERARALNAFRALAARDDPNAFMEYVMRDERTGAPIVQAPIHEAWQQMITDHPRALIWSAVESGKSSQLSVGRVLWELGRNPGLRCCIVSNTHGQAQKMCRAIARYIEESVELRRVFPRLVKALPWTSTELVVQRQHVSKDPSVQAAGVHGNVLGARLDLLVMDDMLDFENTRTPNLRQELMDWYRSTLVGRLTADARVVCVGTAWHPEDFLHQLAKSGAWVAKRFPVVDPDTGASRWPEAWPLSRIAAKREELGPLEFARQMLCVARDDSESRFKLEWIQRCLRRGDGKSLCYGLQRLPPGVRTYTGVDLAVQRHSAADSTVLFTIAVRPNGDREVLEISSGKWSGPEIVGRMIDVHKRFFSVQVVENVACFPPGTRVLTPRGYRPIEAIKIGDEVWTHRARWRRVTDTLTGASKTLTTARAKGCLPVRTTPNHWFMLRRAGRLKGGRAAPDQGKHRPVGDPQWVSYGFRDEPAYVAVAVPRWPDEAPLLRLRGTTRNPARDVVVTEPIALALGLYMAEGHSTRSQVYWTFGAKEAHLADLVERALRSAVRGRWARRHGDGTLRLVVNSVELAEALRFGTGAAKCPPMQWMGWPLELRLAVLRGWFMGDGCARVNNGSTRWPVWMLSGASISRDWMLFARSTLAHAGVASTLRLGAQRESEIDGRKIRCGPIFSLGLTARGSRKLREVMDDPAEAHHWRRWWVEDTRELLHEHHGCMVLGDGSHAWSRVPEIEDAPYEEWDGVVHNLVVEEDESFTVEDFIVHNAQDYVLQFARGVSAIPMRAFTTGRNKAHPEFGVESLAAEMANSKWIIPNNSGRVAPEVDAWITEMLYYDPRSHTGDRLMASWFAREGARLGAMRVEGGRIDVLSR